MKNLSLSPDVREMLIHSTWLAKSWEWLEELAGHAAAAFLTASFVWSGMKLYNPGLALALPGLDTFFSAALFVALDAAGLASYHLHMQAEIVYPAGATQIKKIGQALLILMILTIALASVQFRLHLTGAVIDWSDTLLLLVRSILAVLYISTARQVRHKLKEMKREEDTRLADLAAENEKLQRQAADLAADVKRIQAENEDLKKDRRAMNEEIENLFSEIDSLKMKLAAERQRVSISETDSIPVVTPLPAATKQKRISAPAAAGSKKQRLNEYIQAQLASGRGVAAIPINELVQNVGVSAGLASEVRRAFQ